MPVDSPQPVTTAGVDVLVVDDDPDIRGLLATALRTVGYRVETARDGRDALDRITEARPTLVLLDIHLPGMSGWEAQQRLGASERGVRVVFISADAGAIAAARRQGLACLAKPFNLDHLFDLVARSVA